MARPEAGRPRRSGRSPDVRCTSSLLWAFGLSILSLFAFPASGAWDRGVGQAVAGTDLARLLPPAGATVESYENHGYRLRHEGGEVWVEVDASAVGSTARWRPPTSWPDDALGRLARSLTAGAGTEFEVSSRVLGWVAAHVTYELDRDQSQNPEDILDRRTAYCTGFARLAVGLLRSAGLESREVAGYVLASGGGDDPEGFHRWIETRFSDVGWVFSDPLLSHHYVPATYVRLGSEMVMPEAGLDGLLLERRDEVVAVDVSPHAPPGVRSRRNQDRQLAAALRLEVPGAGGGLAVLEGNAERLTHTLVSDATTFLGLEPGSYLLEVRVAGLPPLVREFELTDRGRTLLTLDLTADVERAAHSPAGRSSDSVGPVTAPGPETALGPETVPGPETTVQAVPGHAAPSTVHPAASNTLPTELRHR